MKNEELLHYVWQYQLFDATNLCTDNGQTLKIIKPGICHTNAGPDFENARIILDDMTWAGKIEIHIFSSDWEKHDHHHDDAYDAVILHVVWKNDTSVFRRDGSLLPTLSLHSRIPASLQAKYNDFLSSRKRIPCESRFTSASDLAKVSMVETALAHRLQRKAAEVLEMYTSTGKNLEEVAYQLLMKNFGFHLNTAPFLRLARTLPLRLLARYRDVPIKLESLMFGLAGFLEDPPDSYARELSANYRFLAHKHRLSNQALRRADWKFLRTRPHNFPTVRLAQAAAVLHQNDNFFDRCMENEVVLDCPVSDYWQKHYDFGKEARKSNGPGKESLAALRVNTLVPLLAAYTQLTGDNTHFQRALQLLEDTPAEKNFITRLWGSLHLNCRSAFDSQGLIEQYNERCTARKCLHCPVGAELLHP